MRNSVAKRDLHPINSIGVLTTGTASIYGGELYPTLQSLEFVRVRISIVSGRGVNLRLYATLRDRGKGSFVGCACHDDEAEHEPQEHPPHGRGDHERRVRELMATRPHAAIDELARRAAEGPRGEPLQSRLKKALASMPEQDRAEAVRFLTQVGALEAHARGA
jgi:hypothetical protein